MSRIVASLLLVSVLLVGCASSEPEPTSPESAAPEAIPQHLVAACDFVMALSARDTGMLAQLVPASGDETVAEEVATITGATIESSSIDYEWDGRVMIATYLDNRVKALGEPDSVIAGLEGYESLDMTMEESGGNWLVATVDGEPALVAVLNQGPNGQTCFANRQALSNAAFSAGLESDDFVSPDSPAELVPEYFDEAPQCPSGGVYTFDAESFAVCSIHGGARN